jgi:hypothetical protein
LTLLPVGCDKWWIIRQPEPAVFAFGTKPIGETTLKRVIANYPNSADKHIVLDGFQYGFREKYDGLPLLSKSKHLAWVLLSFRCIGTILIIYISQSSCST